MLYKEYIKIESDFIPVFSASKDKDHPERWKSFYPHESFKKILTHVIETLEKGSATKDRPIWINGSYGTGKTFASFVIKHILEDNIDEVDKYFSRREISSLRQRLLGIRSKEKILVVHQSSSAGINSQSKLINTIVEAVKRTLRAKGYTYTGAAGILDKVLAILKDPDATFNFHSAFKKYREKFLEYSEPEDVIADLETLDDSERMDLLEVIVEVAEKESYNWSMSLSDLIEWLRDVRTKNNLYAIFFIWDEFTEYFRNNLNNITGLQELAQASSELNFYFLLITHSEAGHLITDTMQRKIIESRFKIAHINLAESTAFQLMAQALIIEPELKDEWSQISHELWESVRRSGAKFITERDKSVKLDDMKKLLPIHPCAAYLLKSIAQCIGSNQRTMFQFICSDEETAFSKFIAEHEFKSGEDNFLTTDFLWNYFFQEDDPNFDKAFQDSMSCYNNFAGFCKNETQRRILKTTLILLALQQKNIGRRGGPNSILRSTLKNISACFSGTPLETDVMHSMNYFVKRGILSPLEEADDVYYIMANTQTDSERMAKIIEQVQQEQSFDKIINDENYGLAQKFKPSNFLQYRLAIQMISPTKFLHSGNSFVKPEINQIPTFYIFAADETEQGKVNQTIKKIRRGFSERCFIVDFSGTPLTVKRYEKFILNKAREEYFQEIPNQIGQVKLAKKSAADIINEWINQLDLASVRVFYSAAASVQVLGSVNLFRTLVELNRKFFGSGPEEIFEYDRFFAPTGLTENIAKCAIDLSMVKGSYGWLKKIRDEFSELTEHGGEQYWLTAPSHPISKMKSIVENTINNNLAEKKSVGLSEIWDALKRPPVGLMKCAGSVFLLTLLLKNYADKNFYIRDLNNNTGLLTSVGLTNLVVITVKELPQAQEKFLIEQTPQQEKFCWISSEIFKIPEEKVRSIDDTIKNIRIHLAQNRYPLWMLNLFVEKNLAGDSRKDNCLQFLHLFSEILKPQNNRNLLKLADEVFSIYEKNHGIVDKLKSIVNQENFQAGTLIYTEQYKPEMKKICRRLEITQDEYLAMFTEKLSADAAYLWKDDEVNKQIDNLFGELRLIETLNPILPAKQKNFRDMRKSLNERLNRIRIPRDIIESFFSLTNFFEVILGIHNNTEKNFIRATEKIEASTKEFMTFFNSQSSVFAEAVSVYIDSRINREVVDKFFREMPTGFFFQNHDEFVYYIKSKLKKIDDHEKANKIFSVWHEVTGTTSPKDWSNQNEIPILCLFMDHLDEVQIYFPALNNHSQLPNDKETDAALQFLRSKEVLRLSDKKTCEQNFISYFCGEKFSGVIDAESLRGFLHRCAGNDVYSWFTKKKIYSKQIKTFTTDVYRQNCLPDALEKVRSLTAQQAQNYLEELVEKDPLFGIRMLEDSQGELS